MPFLVVMVFWLAVIFASFGLFAPRNATVIANLFVCALSVSGAIFLILESLRAQRGKAGEFAVEFIGFGVCGLPFHVCPAPFSGQTHTSLVFRHASSRSLVCLVREPFASRNRTSVVRIASIFCGDCEVPPTNEERNGGVLVLIGIDVGGLSADDQNHLPIRADQVLSSHK
jgi:hypothetical protein